jgi:hypothetical protein
LLADYHYQPKELADHCYQLYEQFRPEIPGGAKGWGAKGDLDLGLIERLARQKKSAEGITLA